MTIQQILDIAEVCQCIIDDKVSKKTILNNPEINESRVFLIGRVRKSVQWMYDKNPNYPTLLSCANYLLSLCNYSAQAISIINNGGGGGSVTPGLPTIIKSPIKILGTDFTDATNWKGQNSDGVTILQSYSLQVFYNDASRFLDKDVDWARTIEGINILISGFDATATPTVEFYIYINR